MSENTLQPIEQKTVIFYDDEITAVVVEGDDQEVYIPLRPLCDYLGVSWSAQFERVKRDMVLSEVVMSVRVTRTDIQEGSKQPKTSEMACLPLDYLNGWLFGINARRVKESVRDKLVRYQKECYRVLAKAFVQPAMTPTSSTSLYQVREMGLAIVKLAEEQIEFESRLNQTDMVVKQTTVAVDGLQQRMQELEGAIASDDAVVTPEEAMQISQGVKAVAIAEGKRTSRNEFGATYGELYRRFGVTSYKQVPRTKFKEVMNWLNEWYVRVSDDEWPF